jgi:hypothetical protein
MLEARLVTGLAIPSLGGLGDTGRHAVAGLIADGLVDPVEAFKGRLVLTLKGRLLADAVVRRILPD